VDLILNTCIRQASRAFIKLESLDGASTEELDNYQALAIKIFLKYEPCYLFFFFFFFFFFSS
jgi:hypothetical protein